jgi:antitoxin VapB
MGSTSQLNIKNPEARELALELSRITGESVTEAVTEALRERLSRKQGTGNTEGLADELMEIGRHWAEAPELDPREPDDILYDENGLIK